MGIIINGLTDTVTAADGSLNIGGDVTIPGELSYDDVTNIDSVGVVTARAGVHVTSGSVGIGTDNPRTNFQVGAFGSGSDSNIQLATGTSGASNILFGDGSGGTDWYKGFIKYNHSTDNLELYSTDDIIHYTSGSERLHITNTGRIGINQASPDAMLQVDYDEGSSEVGLRLRAYNASGSKTWQLSEINGTPGVFTIRNATNAQNNLSIDGSSGYVGVNATNPDRRLEVVETASSLTFPVAVSNHTDASAGVGAGIAFHLTAGGNTRGDFGVVYAGNNNSDGTDFVFRPNDGSTGSVERLRIKGSSGRVGINETSPTARLDINHPHTERGLVVRSRYGDINNAMVKFDADPDSNNGDGNVLHIHGGNSRTDSEILNVDSTGEGTCFQIRGDGRTRVYKQLQIEHASNTAKIIFNEYGANDPKAQIEMDQISGSSGMLRFYTQNSGTLSERMRITNAGHVLKSDTPAFQCKLSAATGSNFNGILVFNSVRYNIGNHYSSSNGRFTAPVDGRYLFAWYTNMERTGGNGSLWADWYVNGGAQGNRMYTHHSGAWELIGGTIIMDLNANDYVQVYTGQPGNWDGGSYGAFSGYLLG